MPKRWWPWRFTLKELATCGCCCRKRRERRRPDEGDYDRMGGIGETSSSTPMSAFADLASKPSTPSLDASTSTTAFPILNSAPSTRFPPRHSSSRKRNRILDHPLRIHRWMFSLFILLLALPLFGAIYSYLPDPISSFLSSLSSLETQPSPSSPSAIGDLYWSLFGKTDSCCSYVQHDDSYTLHYPSDPSATSGDSRGSGDAVAMLTKHAWKTRGETPFWANEGFDIDKLRFEDLPVVACPQAGLRLANGTVIGGN